MTRKNEFVVGAAILAALVLVVVGALYLGEADLRGGDRSQVARFRSVGRLSAGAAVIYRGVRVGTVRTVRLADDNWVEAELAIDNRAAYPEAPAVIAIPASLFGEWQAEIVARDNLPDNPTVRSRIAEAAEDAGDTWPGADLPSIGELTAQANRIANDVGLITSRVEDAIDSTVIADLQRSVAELRSMADRLNDFAASQTSTLGRITNRADQMSSDLTGASASLRNTLVRVDSATNAGQLSDLMTSARGTSANLSALTGDLRELTSAIREQRGTMIRVLQGMDSITSRLQRGQGTLGMLTTDTTLYQETAATLAELRTLLADIRLNPRKYFRFSVF